MNLVVLLPRMVLGTLDVAVTFASAFVLPDGGQRVARRNAHNALSVALFRNHIRLEVPADVPRDLARDPETGGSPAVPHVA